MTAVDTPNAVREIVRVWRSTGSEAQPGIPWPRDRWSRTFPDHRALLDDLPETLGRSAVAEYGKSAARSPQDAERAFVVAMVWGFGTVGYGPWRTRRILDSTSNPLERLHDAARALQSDGPLAAYEEMSSRSRLRWLGPAFGTKYLYFCSASRPTDGAIVLDRLVADWLESNTGLSIDPVPWSVPIYGRYLEHLTHWSKDLGASSAEVECCIFQAEARRRARNQWAQP